MNFVPIYLPLPVRPFLWQTFQITGPNLLANHTGNKSFHRVNGECSLADNPAPLPGYLSSLPLPLPPHPLSNRPRHLSRTERLPNRAPAGGERRRRTETEATDGEVERRVGTYRAVSRQPDRDGMRPGGVLLRASQCTSL